MTSFLMSKEDAEVLKREGKRMLEEQGFKKMSLHEKIEELLSNVLEKKEHYHRLLGEGEKESFYGGQQRGIQLVRGELDSSLDDVKKRIRELNVIYLKRGVDTNFITKKDVLRILEEEFVGSD